MRRVVLLVFGFIVRLKVLVILVATLAKYQGIPVFLRGTAWRTRKRTLPDSK
jgi:hypothetical protein